MRHTMAEPPLASAARDRGVTLGRYLVLDRLGEGGMGEVFVAYDPDLDRKIALKLLHAQTDPAGATERQRRLVREAQVMAKLSHPNVLTVYDVGTWNQRVFVAMELVDGITLGEWLAKPRSWREILESFLRAGAGLAAAHHAGIVHRDFKPDNVLVGNDGRVRVMDFGLARSLSSDGEPSVTITVQPGLPAEAGLDATALPAETTLQGDLALAATGISTDGAARADISLDATSAALEGTGHPAIAFEATALPTSPMGDSTKTAAGVIMGTPAYMSPEQYLGVPTDGRTDQFSFCVALYEALYGERPFAGHTVAEVKYSVTEGIMRPAPRDARVPAHLRRALVRGLSRDPEARWPSMEALLTELANDPSAKRRLVGFVALGAAALIAAAAIPSLVLGRRDEVCTGSQARVATVWDAAKKKRVEAAFVATKVPYAAETWPRVQQALDAYGVRWAESSVDACRATAVRGEQSAELLDLRNACLATRLDALRSLIDVLCEADEKTVEKAVQAANGLPTIAQCDDPAYVRARVKPPSDAATAAAARRIEEELARVRALDAAGNYQRAVDLARPLEQQAVELRFRPLVADARLRLGSALQAAGKTTEAERVLESGYFDADATSRDDVAVELASALVYVVGYRLERFPDGARWSEIALAKVERSRAPAGTEAALLRNVGAMLERKGDYPGALARDLRALAIDEKERPDDAATARDLNQLAIVHDHLGDFEEALALYRRALAVVEKGLGAGHPLNASFHNNIGLVLLHQRKYDEALIPLRRAYDLMSATLPADHVSLAHPLTNQCEAHMHRERWDAALESGNRAAALWEKTNGPEHPRLAEMLTCVGRAQSGAGRTADAIATLERAVRLRERQVGDVADLAESRFALAQALHAVRRDPRRAAELVEQARQGWIAAGPKSAAQAREAEAWTAAHGAASDERRLARP